MHKLINWMFLLGATVIMIGCGADSDLLRDQNVDDTPTGSAYALLHKGIYKYKHVDGKYLGFDYYILDEECKKESCELLHKGYTIFDANITEQADQKYIFLGKNGWHEKSKTSECKISFDDSNMTLECPDGRIENVMFVKEEIKGKKLLDVMDTLLNTSDLKDESSKFATSAQLYSADRTNEGKRYELIQSDASKCHDEGGNPLTDTNISHDKIECVLGGLKFHFDDTHKANGNVNIVNNMLQEFSATWRRLEVFDHYTLLEVESSDFSDTFFVIYYNGSTYIGKVIKQKNTEKYLNKDAFNNIYTQLSDKYTTPSLVKKDLKNGLYQLLSFGNPTYYKISFSDMEHIHMEYGAFFDTKPSANWILTKRGLHRESEECESDIFFNSFRYQCDDGRESEFVRIKNTNLSETLIYTYLSSHNIRYTLDSNDTFFSIGSSEVQYRETSKRDVYMFAPANSLKVGKNILEDNASSLFDGDLFVSSNDKKHYLKILNPKKDANGTVEVYELNSSIELNSTTENNTTFISDNIQKASTLQWAYKKIGQKEIIAIGLDGDDVQEYFEYRGDTMVLTVFNLSKIKVITGELSSKKGKPKERSYLDYNAYKDTESAIVE